MNVFLEFSSIMNVLLLFERSWVKNPHKRTPPRVVDNTLNEVHECYFKSKPM